MTRLLAILLAAACLSAAAPAPAQPGEKVGQSVTATQQDYKTAEQATGSPESAEPAPKPEPGKKGKKPLSPEEEPLFYLPLLDAPTSRVMLFAVPWMILFTFSLIRFAGLASGSLTDGVTKAGPVGLAFGIPGIVLTMAGFFSNFLHVLYIAGGLKDLPEEVRSIAAQVLDLFRPWADFISLFWPEAARWFDTDRAHWAVLLLTAVFVVLAEFCFITVAVVRSYSIRGKSFEVLDRLEKQQAAAMKERDF